MSKEEIMLVVTSAMSRYAMKNNGKRGLSKDDVIYVVVSFGGIIDDVRVAIVVGLKRFEC